MPLSPNNGFVLTAAEMAQAEQRLIDAGVSVEALMQRAGEGAAQWIWRACGKSKVLIVCGPGNNGGDGYVIAEWLRRKGCEVGVAALTEPKTDAAQWAASRWQGETVGITDARSAPVLVDCLFGTGLKRPLVDDLAAQLGELARKAQFAAAIDLPSNVETDSGAVLGPVPEFAMTIALGALKPAHLLMPARSRMGAVVGVDIGVDEASDLALLRRPKLSSPAVDSHKYSRGMVAVVAGEMSGAAWLAARAAQRAGAGYVKLFHPPGVKLPEASSIVTAEYDSSDALAEMLADNRIGCVVVGPGLGRNDVARDRLDCALAGGLPLLLDADALVLLGEGFAERCAALEHAAIATPHQGEFAIIASEQSGSKIDQAWRLAATSSSVLLFKGADSVIAAPDGKAWMAPPAPSWLASAGSGDVLAGIIAARRAGGADAARAAREGLWLHGEAARLAGPALVPEDLIDQLPAATAQCL